MILLFFLNNYKKIYKTIKNNLFIFYLYLKLNLLTFLKKKQGILK